MKPEQNGIIAWFANNSVAANLLMISVIALGLLSIGSIRKEALPSMELDQVTIGVVYDSGEARQAEEGIAIKIEDALETVAGIKRITSTSTAYGSTVVVEKKTGYDLDALLTDVKIKVDAIYNFPIEAEKPVIDKARRQNHALWVQLYGDSDRRSLQALGERLKDDLLAKPAISDLTLNGKADPIISVEVDESQLQAYGLSMSDIAAVLNAESTTAIGASLRNSDKTLRLKASEQAYRADEFAQLPIVTSVDGGVVTLGEVARVREAFEDDPYVINRYNQLPGIGIQIVMDDQGDISEIVEQAQQVVDDWHQRGLLPQGVALVSWYDNSVIITDRLSLLVQNALTGIAMVFVVLALFLNLRVAFWVAAGLPFVFFGTLYFMTDTYTGMTLNSLTTFGFIMALGIVVDDAVVVGESVYTQRRLHGDTLNQTIMGTMKVAVPTLFGVLTTVAAFVALANVSGKMGQIYSQFATIVTICLLLSVVESKLILPSHLAHLNTHKKIGTGLRSLWPRIQHGADAGLQWFSQRVYAPMIRCALQLRYAVVLAFVALFILVMGLPATGKVKVGFFPDVPGDVITASITLQTDASFGQNQRTLEWLESTALRADAELGGQYGASDSGIASLQVSAEEDSSGKVTVELHKQTPYASPEFISAWRRLSGHPEGIQKLKFIASMEMGDNFKVELKSNDAEVARQAGYRFKAALAGIAGVSGIDDNLNPGQPQLKFELTSQGRALGMTSAELSRQLLQAFGGEIVQRYQRNEDEIKVRVRYPERQRQTLADISDALVRTPVGTLVSLSDVAKISSEYQTKELTRIDGLGAVYLTAVVDKSVLAPNELVAQLQRDLVPQLQQQFPQLQIHFAGEAEQQQEAAQSMGRMFIVALLAIYVLLAIPLKSYVQPLLIMTAIPFGIVGAILGHWGNDLTFGILSINGILALSGVVVNDSLLLVSRYNELRQQSIPVVEAIHQACTGRLRAVLLTSLTTYAGLVPLLGETSMQAQFLIPAAASLGYGILFATVITLVLIPSLLMIQEEIKALPAHIRKRLTPALEA